MESKVSEKGYTSSVDFGIEEKINPALITRTINSINTKPSASFQNDSITQVDDLLVSTSKLSALKSLLFAYYNNLTEPTLLSTNDPPKEVFAQVKQGSTEEELLKNNKIYNCLHKDVVPAIKAKEIKGILNPKNKLEFIPEISRQTMLNKAIESLKVNGIIGMFALVCYLNISTN